MDSRSICLIKISKGFLGEAGARFLGMVLLNHTQFGRYGEGLQRGDNPATIDRDAQQAAVVAATLDLLAAIDSQP